VSGQIGYLATEETNHPRSLMSNTARISSSIARNLSGTYGKAKTKTKTKRAPNVGRERADEVLAILGGYVPALKTVPVEAFAEVATFLNECRADDVAAGHAS
jgi:hypothetical protein